MCRSFYSYYQHSQRYFRQFLGFLLLCMLPASIQAGSLASHKWYRIRTPHFDVLFPGHIQREANRLANTMEHLYLPVSKTLQAYPSRYSLVLDTNQADNNGGTYFGPSRINLFTFPAQGYSISGSGSDWLNTLVVHEFRHAAQWTKLSQHGLGGFFIEIASPLLIPMLGSVLVPRWLFEGDAVATETSLTRSGRGRLAYFSLLYKANLLERGGFSYQKAICESYKHALSGPYVLGYHLTTYLRRRYGAQSVSDIIRYTTWGIPLPYAVKLVTGKWLLTVYREANKELSSLWQRQLQGLPLTPVEYLHQRRENHHVNYHIPQPYHKGGLLALKSSLSVADYFVWIDEHKRETKLFTPWIVSPEIGFSVARDHMVWVEKAPDTWIPKRSYSVIKSYNLVTKKLTTLTKKSRYGVAALSPDATRIVAVESDVSYNHTIVILDANNGQVLKRLPNPENYFYRTPQWTEDGRHIVAIKSAPPNSTIVYIDTQTDVVRELLPYSEEHISKPTLHGQYVFYSGGYSGIDNIYATDITTGQRYQVTSRKYGAYHPAVSADGRWLLFNDFTKDGMHIAKMPIDPTQWIPIEQVQDRSIRYYQPMVEQEAVGDIFAHVPNKAYPTERYYPWMHLINFCGWHIDPNFGPGKYGFSDFSQEIEISAKFQDMLMTCNIAPSYQHDFKRETGIFAVKTTYSGLYPFLTAQSSLKRNYAEGVFTQKDLQLGIICPLFLRHGQFTHNFSLCTYADLYDRRGDTWSTQAYVFNASRYSKKALRDIYNPWKQTLKLSYKHTPWGSAVTGQQFFTQVSLYFPGLLSNHSLYLTSSYTYLHSQQLALFDKWLYDRDTLTNFNEKQQDSNTIFGNVGYVLPLWYPDWNIAHLLQAKRIQLTGFYKQYYYPQAAPKNRHQHQYVGATLSMTTYFIPATISLPNHFEVGLSCLYKVGKLRKVKNNQKLSRLYFGLTIRAV